ncbi:MAG: HAD hydrolase-like protein [Phycisphaerales bacterium]|nr:HAD hydrolase-like protein [Phycisphaerales bacterium]
MIHSLVLFDIDATLITTSRTGIKAMGVAGRALFGEGFDENRVEYAGRLDPLIIADLLAAHGLPVTAEHTHRFRDLYRHHLQSLLQAHPGSAKPCPGVPELLDRLAREPSVTLGLLTGNFPETGDIKLRASGVDPGRFAIHVWGSDSPHSPPARDHLPPVGMTRYRERTGRELPARRVTVIGDTPHDIRCAKVHGCRSIGVATGHFSREELARSGADLAVDTLADTEAVARWLTDHAA